MRLVGNDEPNVFRITDRHATIETKIEVAEENTELLDAIAEHTARCDRGVCSIMWKPARAQAEQSEAA